MLERLLFLTFYPAEGCRGVCPGLPLQLLLTDKVAGLAAQWIDKADLVGQQLQRTLVVLAQLVINLRVEGIIADGGAKGRHVQP